MVYQGLWGDSTLKSKYRNHSYFSNVATYHPQNPAPSGNSIDSIDEEIVTEMNQEPSVGNYLFLFYY